MKKIYKQILYKLVLLITSSLWAQQTPYGVQNIPIWLHPGSEMTFNTAGKVIGWKYDSSATITGGEVTYANVIAGPDGKVAPELRKGDARLNYQDAVHFPFAKSSLSNSTGLLATSKTLTVAIVFYVEDRNLSPTSYVIGFGSNQFGEASAPAFGALVNGGLSRHTMYNNIGRNTFSILGENILPTGMRHKSTFIDIVTVTQTSLYTGEIIGYMNGLVSTKDYQGKAMKFTNDYMRLNQGIMVGSVHHKYNSGGFGGGIGDVLVFDRVLSNVDRNSLQSYLAIKYGVTIDDSQYTSSNNTLFWDNRNGNTYVYHVAGIVRDDGHINSSVSHSTIEGGVLTVSTKGTKYKAGETIEEAVELPNNNSAIFWGRNTTAYLNFKTGDGCGAGLVLGNNDIWKFKKTNLGNTELNLKAGGVRFPFSGPDYDVKMLIAKTEADAQQGKWLSVIPGTYIGGAEREHSFDFTMAGDELYVSFGADLAMFTEDYECKFPEKGYFDFTSKNWLQKQRSGTYTATNNQRIEFDYNLYKGVNLDNSSISAIYPRVFTGTDRLMTRFLYSYRDERQKGVMKVNFPDGPTLAKFNIYGIDLSNGLADRVEVVGYLGSQKVRPLLSKKTGSIYFSILKDKDAFIGDRAVLQTDWSRAGVEFNIPVDRIEIIHTVSSGTDVRDYVAIGFGNFELDCPVNGKPNSNGLEFTLDSPDNILSCEEFTYTFNINNYSCFDRVVKLENELPDGLEWVEGSMVGGDSELEDAVINDYGNTRNLSISNIKLEPNKKTTISGQVRFKEGSLSGVYENQGVLTYRDEIEEVDKTMGSCDLRTKDDCTPTKIQMIASDVEVLPLEVSFTPLNIDCYKAEASISLTATVRNPNPTIDIDELSIHFAYSSEAELKSFSVLNKTGYVELEDAGTHILENLNIMRNEEIVLNYEIEIKTLLELAELVSGIKYNSIKEIPREVIEEITDLHVSLNVSGSTSDKCTNANLGSVMATLESDLVLCNKLDKSCYYPAIIGGLTKNNSDFVMMTSLDRTKDGDLSVDDINALLYLESKSKGFVITRMTTPQIVALVEPVAGMLVYDLTEKCLKLYDGVQWSCLVQSCPDE